jgi:hypothetical protein
MGLGKNIPEGLSVQRHVFLGKDDDGIRVGNRISLLSDKNTYIKDLMNVASQAISDCLPKPRREHGTLTVYGRSATDNESYLFSISIKTVNGVAFGSIIKTQNGNETVLTGIIKQREHGVPTDFKYFSPTNKNELCIEDPINKTLTNIDLGTINKLTVECGEIPFESDTHSVQVRKNSIEILDPNGTQMQTLPTDNIAQVFASQELAKVIPSVENAITPIKGSNDGGDFAMAW